MKISYKVPLIATTVILAAFSVFGAFQYKMIEKNIYQQVESDIKEVSNALNAEITNWLNERLRVVSGMAELISKDEINRDELLRKMDTSSFNSSVAYFYAALQSDGKWISNSDEVVSYDWDGRTRPWYKLALKYDQAMMTEPYEDSSDQRLLITAVSKLTDNNQVVGVLGADIELKAVSDAVNAVTFNNTGYVFLVNNKGDIITYPQQELYGKNINAIYTGKKPELKQHLQESTIHKNVVLTAFFPLDQYIGSEDKWFIGIVVDKDKILSPAYKLGLITTIAAILTALLSTIIFYLFMRRTLIEPVRQLSEQADNISRGNLTEEIMNVSRKDEIGDLAKAVQRMQKALHMAINKLAASRRS